MGRKAIIYCIAALCILVTIVVSAVVVLYSGDQGSESRSEEVVRSQASSAHPLLNAVPSDAALVLSCSNFRSALNFLGDTTVVYGQVFSGDSAPFGHFIKKAAEYSRKGALGSLRSSGVCISIHYSGSAVPLFIAKAGRNYADSTDAASILRLLADKLSLHSAFKTASGNSPLSGSTLLIVSPSESLVQSAERHIDRSASILDNRELAAAASEERGDCCIFFDHNFSYRLASSFIVKDYASNASFLSRYASWSSMSVNDIDNGSVSMSGKSVVADGDSDYALMLSSLKSGNSSAASILPDCTRYMSSLSFDSFKSYFTAYKKYLDASGSLNKFNAAAASVKKDAGVLPDHWAETIGVREVVSVSLSCQDSARNAVMLRLSKPVPSLLFKGAESQDIKEYEGKINICSYYKCPKVLFGSLFSSEDSTALYTGGWLIIGNRKALELFSQDKERKTLGVFLKECGHEKLLRPGSVFQSYFAFTADMASEFFNSGISVAASKALDGVTFSPVAFSVIPGSGAGFYLDVRRVQSVTSGGENGLMSMLRDTVVNVPKGPFKVKNCGTGRMNLITQRNNNYITLTETDGKGIWAIPFNGTIRGSVEEVDYYANGKIQFLFASGSSLYLIDRLGRFVKPFPVSVGKEILLGPSVYEFSGTKGYSAVVLHKDNTIGFYDLQGKPRDFWKGVSLKETIKALPELLAVKGASYWIVRTSQAAYLVGFGGGAPVSPVDGAKRIKADSRITVREDGTLSAVCIDGKERTIKIGK